MEGEPGKPVLSSEEVAIKREERNTARREAETKLNEPFNTDERTIVEEMEAKDFKKAEGSTEEQQQEEGRKMENDLEELKELTITRRKIAGEKFNEDTYRGAYESIKEEVKSKIEEVNSFLQEGNFNGAKRGVERIEWKIEDSMSISKECLKAAVDFIKNEILPLLDNIFIVEMGEKKAVILQRVVNRLREHGGSSQEIVDVCGEGLDVLEAIKTSTGGLDVYKKGSIVAIKETLEEALKEAETGIKEQE